MIPLPLLKDAERIARLLMALILLTAGTSKLCSHGGFAAYYGALFQGDLRIRLPPALVGAYLAAIPYLELALGAALLTPRLKPWSVHAWFAFMASLTVGHYVLQEWPAVNDMLDYFMLGLACMILPSHRGALRRDAEAPPPAGRIGARTETRQFRHGP
jgi:uncharacterized membrane protein YphA (DoxX/SURF4 family)